MKNISKFFKAIGSFLNHSVEYFDDRVRTGKFVGDIKVLFHEFVEKTKKFTKLLIGKGVHSKFYIICAGYIKKSWQALMKIHSIEYTVSMFLDACKLFIKYYADIFIVFAISFPSVILLLNFFQNSQIIFFIALIPILLCNLFLVSTLYYVIDKRDNSAKVSLWSAMSQLLKKLPSILKVLLVQTSVIILAGVSFAVIALFFRFFFEAMAIGWSGSFIYWFVVTFIGLVLIIGVLAISVIIHQSYFTMLLDDKRFDESFDTSISFIQSYAVQFFVFYISIYIFYGFIIYWATLYYLYLGIAISVFFFIHASLHLGFLLRRKFISKLTIPESQTIHNHSNLLAIIIVFGLINYALVSVVIVRQFQYITSIIETQRDKYFFSQDLNLYTNTLYKFSIEHPKNWNVYEWRGSSVTFYNNYTGTVPGGIWLNISVSPYDEKEFIRLYNARPGLVILDNATNDFTTKTSNISVQGYQGVNYTSFKESEPYPEYKTHYRLVKENYFYDITFTTLDKNVEGNNTDLFERIVGSFKFIE